MADALDITCNSMNCTNDTFLSPPPVQQDVVTMISVVCYGIICWIGLLGNGLVIFVIARFTNMKTITNLYILNLSIADWLFLLGLPLIITTSTLKHWVFGETLCKLYYMLTCINMFTSAFTLVAMSVDRYLAVCHPVTSMPYRSRTFALCSIAGIWLVSAIVILPVLLYTRTVSKSNTDMFSCIIDWPASHADAGKKLFVIYTLLVGFVIPVILICVLYTLLVLRLRSSRHAVLRRRSQRKVTRLVSTVIGVFVCSWLPYWAFQVFIIVRASNKNLWELEDYHVAMFQCFTILSYANSMVNPLLYAFTNDHFRQAFTCAFRCNSDNALAHMQRRDSDYTSVRRNSHMNGTNGAEHAAVLLRTQGNADKTLEGQKATLQLVSAYTEESIKAHIESPELEGRVFFEGNAVEDIVLQDTSTQTDIPYSADDNNGTAAPAHV